MKYNSQQNWQHKFVKKTATTAITRAISILYMKWRMHSVQICVIHDEIWVGDQRIWKSIKIEKSRSKNMIKFDFALFSIHVVWIYISYIEIETIKFNKNLYSVTSTHSHKHSQFWSNVYMHVCYMCVQLHGCAQLVRTIWMRQKYAE